MSVFVVIFACIFISSVHASEQGTSNIPGALEAWSPYFISPVDLETWHDVYFGRSFIHNEDIDVEKYGVGSAGAVSSEAVVYAAGSCVGGDALLVETNAEMRTRAWYPGAADMGRVEFVSKSFGVSLLNGGVALNRGTIDASASGEGVSLQTDGRFGDTSAGLVSLACGLWATRSGQLAFSNTPPPEAPDATECVAINLGQIAVSSALGAHCAGTDATYRTLSRAYGLYCDDDSLGVNAGQISAMAAGGVRLSANASAIQTDSGACGIFAESGAGAVNTGRISARAVGDTLEDAAAAGGPSATGTVRAQAMGICGGKGATVINTGEISVAAEGGAAGESPLAGAYGLVGGTGSRIVNSGTITVSARSRGTAKAYGIVSTGDAELYSSGTIEAEARSDAGTAQAKAFAVYASEGRLAVKAVTVRLAEEKQPLQGTWGHSVSGSFDFSDATLSVEIDEQTPFETPYRVDAFVAGEANRFARIDCKAPADIEVVGLNNNESVLIRYAPKVNPAMTALRQTTRVVNQCVAMADQALMDAAWERFLGTRGPEDEQGRVAGTADDAVDNCSQGEGVHGARFLFVTPFVTRGDEDSYETRDHGVCGGGYRAWGPDTFAGIHFGLDRGQLDFDPARHQDRETRMTHAVIGVQGLHRFAPGWALGLSSSLFRSGHDFEDKAPQNGETASYTSHGIVTRLSGSFAWHPTARSVLEPEIGLRHEWMHQEAFTTEHMSWLATRYGELDEHELHGEAALGWRGRLKTGNTEIRPHLRLFADHPLTDGKMTGTMALGNQEKTLENRQHDPSFGARLSAVVTDGATALAFGYTGRIEGENTRQSGWVNVQLRF